jgi:hypothetical protein
MWRSRSNANDDIVQLFNCIVATMRSSVKTIVSKQQKPWQFHHRSDFLTLPLT